MLKTQWKAEEAADAEGERQRFILNRERNIELINHNANEKELKAEETYSAHVSHVIRKYGGISPEYICFVQLAYDYI